MSDQEVVATSNVSASLEAVSAMLAVKPRRTADKIRSDRKPDRRSAGTTKAATVEKLLQRKAGASIDQIAEATGWQTHSCRALLTGLRKNGYEVARETGKDGRSVYRIVCAASDAKAC